MTMKLGTIIEALNPLLYDAAEAEKNLSKDWQSQFARRNYIRSIFAYIEGSIWILKQVCLKAKVKNKKIRMISIPECIILNEVSYILRNNGNIDIATRNINLLDNIKFTFKIINKYFNGNIDLGIGTVAWTKLIESKKIRNRITHPKKVKDLEITDDEIIICEASCSWFNELMNKTFELFVDSGKKRNAIPKIKQNP